MKLSINLETHGLCVELYNLTPQVIQEEVIVFLNHIHDMDKGNKPVRYRVWIDGCRDGAKIACIKVIRSFFGWGLKEAKDAVEKDRHILVSGLLEVEAEAFMSEWLAVGGNGNLEREI